MPPDEALPFDGGDRGLVSIVLVTYQSAIDLPECLDSLAAAAGPRPTEVVVVDNASRDDSADLAREFGAKVLENHENTGLSAGINRGVAETRADWVLIMNPDTRLEPESINRLLDAGASEKRIGCVGPRILGSDGSEYPTGRRFPSVVTGGLHALLGVLWPGNPATRRYHMMDVDRQSRRNCDWVSGSCMMVRRTAFDEIGGFDSSYFMYFEEVDFCLRLRRKSWFVTLEPAATITHHIGGSTKSAPYRKIINHHRSALRFCRRRYGRDARLVLLPVVAALLVIRAGICLLWARLAHRVSTSPEG